jgi:hypothetical protein
MIADAGRDSSLTPHTLRHTAGTWLARGGVKSRVAADDVGMTEELFERTYDHGQPDCQAEVGRAFRNAKETRSRLPQKPPSRDERHGKPSRLRREP